MAGAGVVHMTHEGVAWSVALGVGFWWAAWVRADRATGLVPVFSAFVGVLTVLSVSDLLAGHVELGRLATHLLAVLGLALIMLRRRSRSGDGGARAAGPQQRSTDDSSERGAEPRQSGRGGGGLRPTARRRAA